MARYEIDWLEKDAEILECGGMRMPYGGDGQPTAVEFWRTGASFWDEHLGGLIEPQETVLLVNPASVASIRPLELAETQR